MGKNGYKINEELLNINPRYKMGFKLLSKEQLNNIFPTIDSLMVKFDIHRNHITKYKRLLEKSNIQYNLMYDNVFSILGKRGSGKTSVVFTISEILKNDIKHKQDIVLPVIIPEIIPARTDIMGWILTILEDEVEKIEQCLKNNRNYCVNQQNLFFENCRLEENSKLRKALEDVKSSFFSSRENSFRSASYADSISRSENKTKNGYQFSKNLSKFWDELCKVQKKIYECEEEPLIYIIFDDVDLTPHIVEELFATIMKYLAYPNIIVIFTADEQLLEQVINQKVEKEYYEKNNTSNISQIEAWERQGLFIYKYEKETDNKLIQEMAEAYMNKVMPPSSRYYVLNFNNCTEKKKLIQKIENNHEVDVEEFLNGKIKQYIQKTKNDKSKENLQYSFLYYKNKYFIESYLTFFGMTCRQIGNECLIVEDFLSQLEKDYLQYQEKKNKKEYQNQMFLHIQIFVKNTLKNLNYDWDNDDFLKKTFYFEKENWTFFIDYDYIRSYCNKKIKKNQSTEEIIDNVKKMIQIYHLYFFIENILLINEEHSDRKSRERVHGQRMLVRLLDKISAKDVSLVKLEEKDDRLEEFLYTYKYILENPEFLMNYDVNKYHCVRQYLTLYKNKMINNDNKMKKNLEEWKLNHPKWLKSMIEAVTLAFSGIFCIDESDCFVYERLYEMNYIGRLVSENMYKIQDGMLETIKKRIREKDKIKVERQTVQVEDDIEGILEKVQEECTRITYYTLTKKDSKKLEKRIKNISKMRIRYEHLFQICSKIKNELNCSDKENSKVKITSEILIEFKENIIKAYKFASQKNVDNTVYYEDFFEKDLNILSKILDDLNGKLDFDFEESIKKKLETYVGQLVKLNEEYLMCKIKETEDNKYPESLKDLKEDSYDYINKIYKQIKKMYIEDNKTNNLNNYLSNTVDSILESYINKLIDQKIREI